MDYNNKPLITILMAAYNAEKTIGQAIDSVVAQTYPNWELFIVNDCSSDSTLMIAESYDDSRIHVLNNERNIGVSLSRKRGLDVANGEWIAILDSDDMWLPNKLEKQLALARSKNAELVYTGSAFIKDDGNPIDWQLHVPDTLTYRKLLKQNLISNSSALVRTDLYKKHYVIGDNMHEDYAIWLGVLAGGTIAYGIDEPLLSYRIGSNTKTSDKKKSAIMNWNTYRARNISVPHAIYYMFWYTINGMVKHRNINNGKKTKL